MLIVAALKMRMNLAQFVAIEDRIFNDGCHQMHKILHIPTGECRFIIDSYMTKSFSALISDCCEKGRCPDQWITQLSCANCPWFDRDPNESEYLIEKISDE